MGIRYYEVGGAVRDRLMRHLGYPVETFDRDWVVVGATPEYMVSQGFLPVGKDFPVFLHPTTHEEYALARTERKTAPGYHGFVFHADSDVTLEEDLYRRDLTINAMAYDAQSDTLIDPYGGKADLERKILRHVSDAYQEDPVRILRTARFAARFGDFTIAPATLELMRSMVRNGETDHLVAERVWAEMARGLMEPNPERMVSVLVDCGYWKAAFTDIQITSEVLERLRRAAAYQENLGIRLCLLHSALTDPRIVLAKARERRIPEAESALLSLFLSRTKDALHAHDAQSVSELLHHCDVLRRPARFTDFLGALRHLDPTFDATPILSALKRYSSIDAGAIARQCVDPKTIPESIRKAREDAVLKGFP